MNKFEKALESSKKKIAALKHISAVDLYKYHLVTILEALNEDCEDGFSAVEEALERASGGMDPEEAGFIKVALLNLAQFAEELLLVSGYITMVDGPEGTKIPQTTEKTPAGFMERLASLNNDTVEALELLSDYEGDDEEEDDEDGDEDGDDEDDDEDEDEDGDTPPAVPVEALKPQEKPSEAKV